MDVDERVRAVAMTASEAISAGRADYFEALQTAIALVVPADLVMWNSIEIETGRVEIQGRDRDQWEWLLPTVARVSPHNPMLQWFLSEQLLPATARMSDLVDARWALQPSLVLLEDLVQRSTVDASAVGTDPVWDSLTSRERQVAELLTEGWTAAHIARRLRISERTVRKHLEHVYAKLGTHDRLLTARRVARNVTTASS